VDSSRQATFHLDCKRILGDGVAFTTKSSLLWPGITFSNAKGPYITARLHQPLPGQYTAHLETQWTEKCKPLRFNATYINHSSLKLLKHSIDAQFIGAMGFTEEKPFILMGNLQAESGRAGANASLAYGTDEKGRIMATYEIEKQGRHKFNLSTSLFKTKKLEFIVAMLNTEEEKNLALDIIMSRHIAIDFKVNLV
jgi:hypothetical protein